MEYTPYGKGMPELLYEKYEELKKKFRRLKKEYNQLQVEHSRLLFDMDAVIQHEVEVRCKMLKSKLKEVEDTLQHRDSFFSIMRDVLANDRIEDNLLVTILDLVVHEECGDDLGEDELEVVKKFWDREYV